MIGTMQPAAAPAFRCLPYRVKGTPDDREILPLADDMPQARFHENDIPNFFP